MNYIILNENGLCYQKIVKIAPIPRYYDNNVTKFTCPVCDYFNLRHQIFSFDKQCPNCGINLLWKDEEENSIKEK